LGKGRKLLKTLADCLSEKFEEVSPLEFYRDLFPNGHLDKKGKFTKGKYTGVITQVDEENKVKRTIITDDLEAIKKTIEEDSFTIISPVSYSGRITNKDTARELYSITFDLDGIIWDNERPIGLEELLYQFERKRLPKCTYLVASGYGLHLYYVLKKPLRLYSDIYESIRLFRSALTPYIWSDYVTNLSREPQFEAVIQSFRAVGSITKDKNARVRAFKIGDKCTIEYLNSFMADEFKIPLHTQHLSIEEAKKLYPEWYQRRIVDGIPKASNKRWTVNRAFYDWFKDKIVNGELDDPIAKQKHGIGVFEGKRYYSLVCLSAIAVKCNIPRQELEHDAFELMPILDSRTENERNHFTKEDVMKALEAYNEKMVMLPRETIVEFSGLKIEANRRNGRKQALHLAIARSTKKILKEAGLVKEGRPTKKEEILSFAHEHPEMNHTQIAKALGVSRKTVIKWLTIEKEASQE